MIFFTSDTHFGHGNIIKYCNRPFVAPADKTALEANGRNWHYGDWRGKDSSPWKMTNEAVKMMDEALIKNINDVVEEDDTLWHLGDFAFAPKDSYIEVCKEYRRKIKCRDVNIIWGNHDKNRHDLKWLFSAYNDYLEINVDHKHIVLCHYAMAIWNRSHRGAWQLYGHSHSAAEEGLDKIIPGRRSMDVGVDNAKKLLGEYRPFSFDEIEAILGKRGGHSINNHIPKNSTAPEEGFLE